jgi:hypothetical protein
MDHMKLNVVKATKPAKLFPKMYIVPYGQRSVINILVVNPPSP